MVKRKTIMDVAKLAGVSTATVSRVLKQPDLVSEETRELVQAAIRKTAYIPNTQARNLRTRRSGLVVLVVRDIANPFYLEIFSGVEAAAHARGFAVLMGNTQNDAAREQYYFDMLRAHSADGMILMTGKLPDNDWDAYKQLPLVVALEYIPGLDVPCVRIDNERAAQTAVEHLIGLGHQRIAHLAGPLPEVLSRDRLQGYRNAMLSAGLEVREMDIVRGDYTLESGRAAFEHWRGPARPTAVFCANDEMAMGLIGAAQSAGFGVPRDLSVVGFDDIVFSRHWSPPLTTITQPRRELGGSALELLARRLAGEAPERSPLLMPTELVVRGSTAPPVECS